MKIKNDDMLDNNKNDIESIDINGVDVYKNRYYPAKSVCKILDTSMDTLRNRYKDGSLPRYKMRNIIFYKGSDIIDFIESNRS